MLTKMHKHQYHQFTQDRGELAIYLFMLALCGALEVWSNFQGAVDARQRELGNHALARVHSESLFRSLYCDYDMGCNLLLQCGTILAFKKEDDYIKRYSKLNAMSIVSIFQRRILNENGKIDGGLMSERRELLKEGQQLEMKLSDSSVSKGSRARKTSSIASTSQSAQSAGLRPSSLFP